MAQVIGELKFAQAGRPITAHLCVDLRWSCEDKNVEDLLNESFGMMNLDSAATDVHEPVVHGIYQVAERLGAEVRLQGRQLHVA